MHIDEVLAHPGEPVASERFVVAMQRAAGHQIALTPSVRRFDGALDTPMDVADSMDLKAQTFAVIRALCSPREQIAADLGEPTAWHWLAGEDWVTEVAVHGTGGGAVRHTRMPARETNDPFRIYRLVEAFDLQPDASVSLIRHAAGSGWTNNDPVVAAIGHVTNAMHAFNGTQQPRTLRLDVNELTDALLHARRQSLTDARALTLAVPILGERRQPPAAETLYLVLIRGAADRPLYVDELMLAAYETGPSDTGQERVHVVVIDAPRRDDDAGRPDESPRDTLLRRANLRMQAGFGRDATGGILSQGVAQDLITSLLAYSDNDVRFIDDRFPDYI